MEILVSQQSTDAPSNTPYKFLVLSSTFSRTGLLLQAFGDSIDRVFDLNMDHQLRLACREVRMIWLGSSGLHLCIYEDVVKGAGHDIWRFVL